MYKKIIVAIDPNDETSWRKPLVSAVKLARKFGAELRIVTIVRDVEAILQSKRHRFLRPGRTENWETSFSGSSVGFQTRQLQG